MIILPYSALNNIKYSHRNAIRRRATDFARYRERKNKKKSLKYKNYQ